MDNMELIITEKNIAAQQISRLLAQGGKPVYNTPVYRFNRDGHECVAIGLKGHILGLDFPQELIYKKKTGWVGLEEDGEVIDAPDVPKELPTPPWKSKRRPYIPEGINLKGWKIPSLPYLTYAPIVKLPAEKDIIRSLKNLAKKADEIVIATDFDREGELIGLDAISVVREVNETAPITRSRYSAFVKKEIEEAFSPAKLTTLDYDLAHAGETRQYIDLIWGAVLTRYLTCVKYSGIGNTRSAGRVQTPTLALVVERERERMAFVPEDYWQIRGVGAAQGQPETAFKMSHATARFTDKDAAETAFSHVDGATTGTITAVSKRSRKQQPPTPFNTTSLQAAAAAEGISPARTMRIAESLYMAGFISYPRVDNTVYPRTLDIAGIVGGLSEKEIVNTFIAGAADMMSVVLIIALARGISVLMAATGLDTYVLTQAANALSGVSGILFAPLAWILYFGLSFLIPSTSGMATVSMPIMGPLAAQLGLFTPTSGAIMGGLALARIEWTTWLKFALKIVVVLSVVSAVICTVAIMVL